ncbi:MAG: hypothetical protein IJ193_04735 [Bacilli bacterium]|nr:hypothetical protein [Bacilli bacterium]
MNKKVLLGVIGTILLTPTMVLAKDTTELEHSELVARTTKYFKTETRLNEISINAIDTPRTRSYEVTEEEYNNAEGGISTRAEGTVETTYKKMVTSIWARNSGYRFDNTLTWKNMPSVRSFDIIAIGKNSNTYIYDGPYFSQRYCTSSGSCYTSFTHTVQTWSTGAGATCQLMTGGLSSLKINIQYDVLKNVSYTLYGLTAYGDYSHATSTVTNSQAQNYTVNSGGIHLGDSIYSSYDSIDTAEANWYGTW